MKTRFFPGPRIRAGTGFIILLVFITGIVSGYGMLTEPDTDRIGGSYAKNIIASKNPDDCSRACLADSQCLAATYVKPNTFQGPDALCWMKDSVWASSSCPDCITFVKIADNRQMPIDIDKTIITHDTKDTQKDPAIDGNFLVWTGRVPGSTEDYDQVFLYDITTQTTTQVTNDAYNHKSPDIAGDKIVWTDSTGLVLYNITTRTKSLIVNDTEWDITCPSISPVLVAWLDYRHMQTNYVDRERKLFPVVSGNSQVYLYHLHTSHEERLTFNDYGQSCPATHNDLILWQTEGADNPALVLYSVNSGILWRHNLGSSIHPPLIYNKGRVFWIDHQNIKQFSEKGKEFSFIPAGPSGHSSFDVSDTIIIWDTGFYISPGLELYDTSTRAVYPLNDTMNIKSVVASDRHCAGVIKDPKSKTDGGNIVLFTLPSKLNNGVGKATKTAPGYTFLVTVIALTGVVIFMARRIVKRSEENTPGGVIEPVSEREKRKVFR